MVRKRKHSPGRGRIRISRKHQATIPIDALRKAGLRAGDELSVEATGIGRIVLVRAGDSATRHAGQLTGVYGKRYLTVLRREWR